MEENMNKKAKVLSDPTGGVRKSYLQPEIEVYACEPQHMIAESEEYGGGAGNVEPNPGGDIDDDPTGGGGAFFGGGAAKNHRDFFFSDIWEE